MKTTVEKIYKKLIEHREETTMTMMAVITYLIENREKNKTPLSLWYATKCYDLLEDRYLTNNADIRLFLRTHQEVIEKIHKQKGGVIMGLADMRNFDKFKSDIDNI